RLFFLAAGCAILPDIDVIGFQFGVRYGDMLGHRGITHSITFAVAVSAVVALASPGRPRWLAWLCLFLATVSHGLFDAMTDGGLGVAFFAPFSEARYFFPFRPIHVSPIG